MVNHNVVASMTCEVPSFQEKKVDGKNVVFFKVQVGFSKNNKWWGLERRYREFDDLDKVLRGTYPNVPNLPGKTLFKLSEAKAIEDRRTVLNEYMKALIVRKDVRTCQEFRKFLDFESNFPQSTSYDARKVGVISDFTKGVRDFIYMPQYQTCLVAVSEMNLASRVDSYFTNVSSCLSESIILKFSSLSQVSPGRRPDAPR